MPKSKRDKRVSLTQTRKKGLESKQTLVEKIRESVDKYARIFVFSVQNMRNCKLKDVRQEWTHSRRLLGIYDRLIWSGFISRFFFGKNKVMSLALGSTKENEYKDSLHRVSRKLSGQMGLLFTNKTKDEVLKWFGNFREVDFARSGNKSPQTVILEEGPLPEFTHSMEPQLRQLGLPTTLQKGVITLTTEHKVCDRGDTLTPEQCRVLKLFGHMLSEFYISVLHVWSNDGTFQELTSSRPESLTPHKIKLKGPQKMETGDADKMDSDDDDQDDVSAGGSDGIQDDASDDISDLDES